MLQRHMTCAKLAVRYTTSRSLKRCAVDVGVAIFSAVGVCILLCWALAVHSGDGSAASTFPAGGISEPAHRFMVRYGTDGAWMVRTSESATTTRVLALALPPPSRDLGEGILRSRREFLAAEVAESAPTTAYWRRFRSTDPSEFWMVEHREFGWPAKALAWETRWQEPGRVPDALGRFRIDLPFMGPATLPSLPNWHGILLDALFGTAVFYSTIILLRFARGYCRVVRCRCPMCAYDLRILHRSCPECGLAIE